MEDIEVKEELKETPEVETKPEEEKVEDFFNPFADLSSDEPGKEAPVEPDKSVDKVETAPVADTKAVEEIKQVKATVDASREVAKLVKDRPEFAEFAEDLIDITSKAMVRGHAKPLEFAVRNLKSPEFWIEYGKKMGAADAQDVLNTRVGGSGFSRSEGYAKDFSSMDTNSFEALVSKVKNQ